LKTSAIILARGGSKGIPNKNILNFCGKPLVTWTIDQCKSAKKIDDIWVSSDSEKILEIARESGVKTILRPAELSGDFSTSESGWLHALDYIDKQQDSTHLVIAPQVTSPLREHGDLDRAINKFYEDGCDSMFSCCVVEDLLFWKKNAIGNLESVNYDYNNRQRRQDIQKQFIENGSFYLFRPEILRKYNNRFGGIIGCVGMEFWKMFEIDRSEDIRMCSALMTEYLL